MQILRLLCLQDRKGHSLRDIVFSVTGSAFNLEGSLSGFSNICTAVLSSLYLCCLVFYNKNVVMLF